MTVFLPIRRSRAVRQLDGKGRRYIIIKIISAEWWYMIASSYGRRRPRSDLL